MNEAASQHVLEERLCLHSLCAPYGEMLTACLGSAVLSSKLAALIRENMCPKKDSGFRARCPK